MFNDTPTQEIHDETLKQVINIETTIRRGSIEIARKHFEGETNLSSREIEKELTITFEPWLIPESTDTRMLPLNEYKIHLENTKLSTQEKALRVSAYKEILKMSKLNSDPN